MSHVVVSSFENIETGDLQAQGESIAVFPSGDAARAHFTRRAAELDAAALSARASDGTATWITWLVLLEMPLELATVEEALEDLETIIEETETPDDPFGELVLDFRGSRRAPDGDSAYERRDALRDLEGWLS